MKTAGKLLFLLLALSLFLFACKPDSTPSVDPATAVAQTMAAAQGTLELPTGPVSIETAVALTIQAASANQPTALPATPVPLPQQTQATGSPSELLTSQRHILLWDPAGSAELLGQVQAVAEANALSLLVVPALTAESINTMTELVVSTVPAESLSQVALAAPDTDFLSMGIESPVFPPNVSVYKAQSGNYAGSHAQNAFVAGYIFGLITPDYRAGVISQAGTDAGLKTSGGFRVGEQYYCGICNSRYAPVTFYPKFAEITNPASEAEWQAAANALLADAVTSVFIQPEVSSAGLVEYLRAKGVLLIGVEGQAGIGEGSGLVATISSAGTSLNLPDALQKMLDDGKLDPITEAGLNLINVNRALLSEGKQAYFEVVRKDLVSGLIYPLPFGQ